MASSPHRQQTVQFKRNANNLYYAPSPTNTSFEYLAIATQSAISYMITPPTPLVSLPSQSFTRNARTVAPPVAEEVSTVVKEEMSVIGFIDWTAEVKWWIDSDVEWSGYVEYPISSERSSIAREAEHRINAELETEKRRRETLRATT